MVKYTKKSYKRKSAYRPRRTIKKKSTNANFKRAVMSVINKNAETKTVLSSIVNNFQLEHNSVINLSTNAFQSDLGAAGEGIDVTTKSRIGKDIYIKGIKVSMNLESSQYRPKVTYWLYLIRNKLLPDDTINTKDQMFEGVSTTIPCDYINTDLVDIMYCKKFTLKMPNMGTTLTAGAAGTFDTAQTEGVLPDLYEGIYSQVTNPQYVGKFYVPINKKITFRDNNGPYAAPTLPQPQQRYQWVIIPYDNFSTTTGSVTWPAGHVTMTTQMLFTDV